jgi:XapX domain-containing protein
MKILIGLIVSFLIGVSCRYFDVPVPSPPVLPGALLVLAMTLGYTAADRLVVRKDAVAATRNLRREPTRPTAKETVQIGVGPDGTEPAISGSSFERGVR